MLDDGWWTKDRVVRLTRETNSDDDTIYHEIFLKMTPGALVRIRHTKKVMMFRKLRGYSNRYCAICTDIANGKDTDVWYHQIDAIRPNTQENPSDD